MEKAQLLAAIGAIMPLCNKPEQIAFLNTLSEAPAPVFEALVKNLATSVNASQIGTLVDSEFPHLDPAVRESIKTQALGAHNFLSGK